MKESDLRSGLNPMGLPCVEETSAPDESSPFRNEIRMQSLPSRLALLLTFAPLLLPVAPSAAQEPENGHLPPEDTIEEIERELALDRSRHADEKAFLEEVAQGRGARAGLASFELARRALQDGDLGSAEADLGRALPALEQAMIEVDKLDKSSISEVKAYASPPKPVQTTLEAVMIMFGCKKDWLSIKKKIGEMDFLKQVKQFDKDNIPNSTLSKVKKYIAKPGFDGETVGKVSKAAGALCVLRRSNNSSKSIIDPPILKAYNLINLLLTWVWPYLY